MPYGLYISAAGAHVQQQRLDIVANNLANVDTVGFKRELAIVQARHSEAIEQGEAESGSRSIDDIGGGVSLNETTTDFSPGALKQTGNAADLAIDGNGFFVVDRNGQQLLTRAGNFHWSQDGRLLTQAGDPVLSVEGAPIQVGVGSTPEIIGDGNVSQDGQVVAQIGLQRPGSLGDLAHAGENYFTPLAPTTPVPPEQRRIATGYLESSNIRPTQAMMELIEASRAYESNVKLIQNQDHMIGELLSRVLRQ